MRKIKRNPEQLGSLDLFASLDTGDGSVSLQDVQRQQKVVTQISQGLSTSLGNPARTHGWRVQALFEAVVVELAGVKLIKTEDAGDSFHKEGVDMKLPDFRLVLDDGAILLVEVKNVPPGDLATKVGLGEFEALQRYAELNKARLVFAHYWSAINRWALVDPVVFERSGTSAHIPVEKALAANELVFLGDATLATTPPLVLRLRADKDQPRSLREEDGSQVATFTVGGVEVLAGGNAIADDVERRIAFAMAFFGGWEPSESIDLEDDEVLGVDFSFNPEDYGDHPETPHHMVAPLSSIYSTQFNLATLNEDGTASKLRLEPKPGGLAGLVPADYWDRPERKLRLWRFEVHPGQGPRARDRPGTPASG